ncbi:MAG: DUF5711 family protein [Gemmiger sp.]
MPRRDSSHDALDRMMAREQGRAAPPPPPKTSRPAADNTAGRTAPRTKKLSALAQKRRRRRLVLLGAVVLIIAAAFAVLTGAVGASLAALGDGMDSVTLYLNRSGGGWPVNTAISQPRQICELAGGFVELGAEDVAVYSAYGVKVRSFQPGYARPALAAGNTRFCVYNRAGSELRVESRTKTLYTKNFSNGILLCALSNNGSVAVITESSRYAAQVEIYDSLFKLKYTWCPTQKEGTPVVLRFASDNRRFAAGCLSASDGQIHAGVYLMDTATEEIGATYAADPGSMVVELDWITGTRLLAVFDDYAAVLDASTGAEIARWDYGGATLQSVSVSGRDVALLLASRSGSTLVLLDDSMQELARCSVGKADSVSCTRTAAYVLTADSVQSYSFNGTLNWTRNFSSTPIAVLDAAETLVFTGTTASVLEAPDAGNTQEGTSE